MNSEQWGIFNDEAAEFTANEAVEAGFWSKEEAEQELAARYTEEDECFVHLCVEEE
jgi:hypothetical protein